MKILTLKFILCAFLLSGCGAYRMPSDDDLSTVPVTNNPHVVRDKGSSMPGVSY